MRTLALECAVLGVAACQSPPDGAAMNAAPQGTLLSPWKGALPVGIGRGLPLDQKDGGFLYDAASTCFYRVSDGMVTKLPDDPDTGKPACLES